MKKSKYSCPHWIAAITAYNKSCNYGLCNLCLYGDDAKCPYVKAINVSAQGKNGAE